MSIDFRYYTGGEVGMLLVVTFWNGEVCINCSAKASKATSDSSPPKAMLQRLRQLVMVPGRPSLGQRAGGEMGSAAAESARCCP